MTVITTGMMQSQTVQWETPKDLFDKLDAEFHFTLDVCASDGMQKCPRYFNPETDGLKQVWGGGGSVLHESPLWKGDRSLGKEGGHFGSHNGSFATGQDGHPMVSEVGAAIRFRGPFYQGKGKVRRFGHRCTVPFTDSDMEHTEDAKVRGD